MTDGSQAIIELCKCPTRSVPASDILEVQSAPDDGVANQPYAGIWA